MWHRDDADWHCDGISRCRDDCEWHRDDDGWLVSIGTRARILRHESTYQMSRAHVSYDTNPPRWSQRRRRADAQRLAGYSVETALMALPARALRLVTETTGRHGGSHTLPLQTTATSAEGVTILPRRAVFSPFFFAFSPICLIFAAESPLKNVRKSIKSPLENVRGFKKSPLENVRGHNINNH